MLMNITCVNALAFIGGIGLAATQPQSLPSDGGTMAESRMQQVVSAVATLSEEVTMTDVDSVRRATMLRQRAQELTAAANREPARRTHLLSLAETYRSAADELAPDKPDLSAETFSTSAVKQTE
jgi:hypothetical protein